MVAPTLQVLVARNAVHTGQIVKPDDLRWQSWPEGSLAPTYIVEGKRPMSDFVGAVARGSIAPGEPITEGKLVLAGTRGFMAAVLQPGTRAVSVPITATSAVSGFIYAGDRVDVLLTHVLQALTGAKEQHTATETVLRNARVIAMDQRLDFSPGDKPDVAKTATLELTPKQSEIVTLAVKMGDLSLVLRSLQDPTRSATETARMRRPSRATASPTTAQVSRLIKPLARPRAPAEPAKQMFVLRGSTRVKQDLDGSTAGKSGPQRRKAGTLQVDPLYPNHPKRDTMKSLPLPAVRRQVASRRRYAGARGIAGLRDPAALVMAQVVSTDPAPAAPVKPKPKPARRGLPVTPTDNVADELNRREAERVAKMRRSPAGRRPPKRPPPSRVEAKPPRPSLLRPAADVPPARRRHRIAGRAPVVTAAFSRRWRRQPAQAVSATPASSAPASDTIAPPAQVAAAGLPGADPADAAGAAPAPPTVVRRARPAVRAEPGRAAAAADADARDQKGTAIKLPGPASTVFVAAPDIADVQVKSPSMIYVFAKKPGDTVLYAVDDQDRVLLNTIVSVTSPFSRMKANLDAMHPETACRSTTRVNGIVLSGTVRSAVVAEDARKIALQHVGGNNGKVINNIRVEAPNQVQLRVKIAEVNRESLKRLGINWQNMSSIASVRARHRASGLRHLDDPVGGRQRERRHRHLEQRRQPDRADRHAGDQNQANILAEPNLVAMSGETASFLAGGEIPVIAPQGGTLTSSISVAYKQVGVSLAFTPTIIGDRINLKVAPEVSQVSTGRQVERLGAPGSSHRPRHPDAAGLDDGRARQWPELRDRWPDERHLGPGPSRRCRGWATCRCWDRCSSRTPTSATRQSLSSSLRRTSSSRSAARCARRSRPRAADRRRSAGDAALQPSDAAAAPVGRTRAISPVPLPASSWTRSNKKMRSSSSPCWPPGARGCGDPVTEQAQVETRHDPVRADRLVAVDFAPGSARLDPAQERELRVLAAGRRADRDEFVVVTDGSGGPIQHSRAAHVAHSLAQAGARWVSRVGRAGDGARARPGRGGALGVPHRNAQLPDLHAVVDLESRTSSAMPGFGCADCLQHGPDAGPSARCRSRPRARSGRGHGRVPMPSSATGKARVRAPSAAISSDSGGSSGGGCGGGGAPGRRRAQPHPEGRIMAATAVAQPAAEEKPSRSPRWRSSPTRWRRAGSRATCSA